MTLRRWIKSKVVKARRTIGGDWQNWYEPSPNTVQLMFNC